LAISQWEKYCDVFERHKDWEVKVLLEARAVDGDHCPDSAFVEDTAVIFRDEVVGGDVAVVCINMAETRRPEVAR